MTRLKIDLSNGVFEVEGEEEFVEKIYNEYKQQLFSKVEKSNFSEGKKTQTKKQKPTLNEKQAKGNGKAKTKRVSSYTIDNILKLDDLKEFYKEKNPDIAYEKNLVFVYFLQKRLELKNINDTHIYTCYKFVNEKIPTALKQSLSETSRLKSWIDSSSLENIKVSIVGENYVEHDLPKSKKE